MVLPLGLTWGSVEKEEEGRKRELELACLVPL